MQQIPDAPYIREAETKGYWPLWQYGDSCNDDEEEAEDDYI